MSVYAVMLKRGVSEVKRRILSKYEIGKDLYEFSDTLLFIHDDSLAEHIAKEIGIKGDSKISGASGVVFRLNSAYAGFADRSLWEWLKKVQERT
jgi:hypothetical protein